MYDALSFVSYSCIVTFFKIHTEEKHTITKNTMEEEEEEEEEEEK